MTHKLPPPSLPGVDFPLTVYADEYHEYDNDYYLSNLMSIHNTLLEMGVGFPTFRGYS